MSLPLNEVGNINLGITTDQIFAIPASVPSDAKEVLVYVYTKIGGSSGGTTHIKVYTQKSEDVRFVKYLTTEGYGQNAHTFTANNMWFPLTIERLVHASVSNALSGNTASKIYVIGYR